MSSPFHSGFVISTISRFAALLYLLCVFRFALCEHKTKYKIKGDSHAAFRPELVEGQANGHLSQARCKSHETEPYSCCRRQIAFDKRQSVEYSHRHPNLGTEQNDRTTAAITRRWTDVSLPHRRG